MTIDTRRVGSDDCLALILGHATDRPDATSLQDDYESLTYAELAERVAEIAAGLTTLGVRPGDRVGLRLPNSAAFVATALGCLWIGAAFVPLAIDDPPARLARILDDSNPKLIVCADATEDLLQHSKPHVTDLTTIRSAGGPIPERSQDPERDAYLIYTSGTTGMPKGVRTPVRAFDWAISVAASILDLDPTTRTLCVSPFHFDGSYGTLFPTLLAGGTVVIPRREALLFVKRFFTAVLENGITHTGFSPSYLRLVLSSPKLPSLATSQLRSLGLGGEECIAHDLGRLWDIRPDLRVFNYYGPTETTIRVTTYEVDRRSLSGGKVPIGMPHPGVTFCLVDTDGRVIHGPDKVGELYIGGHQLMRGYWGDDALSAKVLRHDILPGAVLYKTGDLVRRDEHGRYVYVGRSDDVVKRRGVRTSLGEIARVLRDVEGVSGAACFPIDVDGKLGIAAFVQADSEMTVPALLQSARSQLPASLLPDEFFISASLPMTSSGKLDRRALLAAAGLRGWELANGETCSSGHD